LAKLLAKLLLMVPDVPTAANIPAVACIPGDVVAHNVSVASAVAVDSTVVMLLLPLAFILCTGDQHYIPYKLLLIS
jgi:hypothetical protein